MRSRLLLDAEELASFRMSAPTVLDNVSCLYCSTDLALSTRTKEHVVGRRFVPKGKLQRSWNLIGYACAHCNNVKSRLEDECAAISMQPDIYGKFAFDDETLRAEAARKAANSYSTRTRRPIGQSKERIAFDTRHPSGVGLSFSFVASPQVSADTIFELCRFQICAFFYMLTFDDTQRRGRFWQGVFMAIEHVKRSDWGNARIRSFARAVKTWEPRLLTTDLIADGFYKIAIRKHPDEDCWSWALEWNHSVRCVGLFGDEGRCDAVESSLEKNVMQLAIDSPDRKLAYRLDIALSESEDELFQYEDASLA